MWWHVKNADIQRCSDFRMVYRVARAIVQEQKKEHSRAKIACVSIQEDFLRHPGPPVPFPVDCQHGFFCALESMWYHECYTYSAFSSKVPETSVPSRSISLSFAALKPDAGCSWWAVKVRKGNCFHYLLVSSTLKMRSGEWFPSSTMTWNSAGYTATAPASALATSTLTFTLWHLLGDLNSMNQTLITKNVSSASSFLSWDLQQLTWPYQSLSQWNIYLIEEIHPWWWQ